MLYVYAETVDFRRIDSAPLVSVNLHPPRDRKFWIQRTTPIVRPVVAQQGDERREESNSTPMPGNKSPPT